MWNDRSLMPLRPHSFACVWLLGDGVGGPRGVTFMEGSPDELGRVRLCSWPGRGSGPFRIGIVALVQVNLSGVGVSLTWRPCRFENELVYYGCLFY